MYIKSGRDASVAFSPTFIFLVFSLLVSGLLSGCGGSSASVASADSTPDSANMSGSISVQQYSSVDKDIEEQFNSSIELRNNTPEDAQFITNPVTLGGYLSGFSGNYSDGLEFLQDDLDYFQVDMVEGQSVSLSVFYADEFPPLGEIIDVTLSLMAAENPDVVLVSKQLSGVGSEFVEVPESGDYLIELHAEHEGLPSSPVLYTLAISQSVSVSVDSELSAFSSDLNAEFVPGEVIVKYKSENLASELPDKSTVYRATAQGGGLKLKKRLGAIAGVYQIEEAVLANSLSFDAANGFSSLARKKWQTLAKISELSKDDSVLFAEPNYLMRATSINDTRYPQQWNLPMIEAPAAWPVATGQGVKVAVLDTGIHSDHSDLTDNVSPEGYDFVTAPVRDGDGVPGRDNDPYDPGTTFHGSHVAGIIAASANTIGIRGVAYNAQIIPLRVLGYDGEGATSDIIDAVLYAAGILSAGGNRLSVPADVINLSLGNYSESQALRSAINQALSAGSIVVAAAGNDRSSSLFYPAAYDGVIGVSSVNERKERSGFSNEGSYVDVAAPGGTYSSSIYYDGFQDGILSTVYPDEYSELIGTSMSAPHVSAVLALMKEVQPDLGPEQVSLMLEQGLLTEKIDLDGVSEQQEARYFGAGLVNAAKAVAAAGGEIPDTLIVSPGELGFLGGNSQADIQLSNPGSDNTLMVTGISSSRDWLSITATSDVDDKQLGRYLVEVDLPATQSIDSAEIEVEYTIGGGPLQSEIVPVFVSKTVSINATVGNLNVYLLKLDDLESDQETIEIFTSVGGQYDPSSGSYYFALNDIPNGQYILEASTNNDGDRYWFDLGEARGAYPLLSQLQILTVNGVDLTNLDFEVGHQTFLNSSAALNEQHSIRRLAPYAAD